MCAMLEPKFPGYELLDRPQIRHGVVWDAQQYLIPAGTDSRAVQHVVQLQQLHDHMGMCLRLVNRLSCVSGLQ